jgi:hypothetical protein
MKRYWLSFVVAVFSVLCISGFYIQAAVKQLPDFALQTKEGDEKEASAFMLRGQYGQNRYTETVNISYEGSEYTSQRTFLERMTTTYWGSDGLTKLSEEHRQFMRGKREPFSFYEGGDLVAYVNVTSNFSAAAGYNPRFMVSVLDKKGGGVSSYELSVPDGNKYQQLMVHDIQVMGEQLKVVTENYSTTGGRSEVHLYTLGLMNDKTPIDQTLLSYSGTSSPDTRIDMRRVNDTDEIAPHQFIAFHIVQVKNVRNDGVSYREQEVGGQVHIYNIQTGDEMKMQSGEIADLLGGQIVANTVHLNIEADHLYLTKEGKEGLSVIKYSIPDGKVTANDIQVGSIMSSIVKNQRIYMLLMTDKGERPSTVAVADVNTGKLLYTGVVSLRATEQSSGDSMSKLFVHELVVK